MKPPTGPYLSRRSALLLPLLLASCGGDHEPPRAFPPLTYDYLTKIRLDVARIDVDDSWTPKQYGRQHVEYLSPVAPLDALRRMGQDRLIPGGSNGHAVFVIDDASIVQVGGRWEGNFAVHLDVSSGDGTRSGYAEARVSRVRSLPDDDSAEGIRAALYDMTRQMMDDMNVEFEYQIRRSLRDYLQSVSPGAPTPAPVQTQDLAPPSTP
jgi:hypothetical protein